VTFRISQRIIFAPSLSSSMLGFSCRSLFVVFTLSFLALPSISRCWCRLILRHKDFPHPPSQDGRSTPLSTASREFPASTFSLLRKSQDRQPRNSRRRIVSSRSAFFSIVVRPPPFNIKKGSCGSRRCSPSSKSQFRGRSGTKLITRFHRCPFFPASTPRDDGPLILLSGSGVEAPGWSNLWLRRLFLLLGFLGGF